MCKPIIVTLSLLFIVVVATAQESSSEKVINRFELVGGPSFSSNTGDFDEYEPKLGGSFGVGYYQKIHKSFCLNIRALYESKGSAFNYPTALSDGTNEINVNYKFTTKFRSVSFYLIPTLQLGRNKNIYVGAGGYYSLLYRMSVGLYTTNTDTGEVIEDATSSRNYFDPVYVRDGGATFQLGYAFKISEKYQLMIQGFANRGLVDIDGNWFGSQRNNTYGILLSARMR
jgi:hypothetical protein